MATPANAAATTEATALYNYLYALSFTSSSSGKLIAGQYAGWHHDSIDLFEEVNDLTGMYPGVLGSMPLRTSSNPLTTQPRLDSIYLISHVNSGGIIEFQDAQLNPWTGGGTQDTTTGSISELLNPNTTAGGACIDWFDATCDELQKYKNANVPVIFRPYHEMNFSGLWWWSEIGSTLAEKQSAYRQLYRYCHDYYVISRGMDHILWNWNLTSSRDASRTSGGTDGNFDVWWPGDGYVDIPSFDNYHTDFDARSLLSLVYPWLITKDRPIANSEFGGDNVPGEDYTLFVTQMRDLCPRVTYFNAWLDNDWDLAANNPVGVMSHQYVLDRSEIVIGPPLPLLTAPTISPPPQNFYPTLSISFSSPDAPDAFYYTTDGSPADPTKTIYTGAFPISMTTTVRVMCTKAGWTNSPESLATFTLALPTPSPPLGLIMMD